MSAGEERSAAWGDEEATVLGSASGPSARPSSPDAASAAWVRWLNGVRYRALLALLGRTHVGRAVLFMQWSNGFKAGRLGR